MARSIAALVVAFCVGVVACGGSDDSESSEVTNPPSDGNNPPDGAPGDGHTPTVCVPSGDEVCDGVDNNCDGLVDEGYVLRCSPCDAGGCIHGVVTGGSWSAGIKRNLRKGNDLGISLPPLPKRNEFVYISNSQDDTVSKLRISDGVEDGRFLVGDNPSRTAVDGDGNAWVAMRGQLSDANPGPVDNVVKIDGACTPTVAPPAVTRECILLDIPKVGQILRGVAVDAVGDVWIGSHADMEVIRLDGEVGLELARIPLKPDARVYGLAVDEHGYIWVAARVGEVHVLRIDPVSQEVDVALNNNADLERNTPYGIAADGVGGIWFGTNTKNVFRVDNQTGLFDKEYEVGKATRGVAIDDEGHVWAADSTLDSVLRINPDNGEFIEIMVGRHPVGVAIDHDGDVWTSNQNSHDATKLTPEGATVGTYPVGRVPYTYSDMTGSAFRVFKRMRGVYTATFDTGIAGARWTGLTYAGSIPSGSTIAMRARAADGVLDDVAWAEVTLDGLSATLELTGRQIEAEVVLVSTNRAAVPNVEQITFTFKP